MPALFAFQAAFDLIILGEPLIDMPGRSLALCCSAVGTPLALARLPSLAPRATLYKLGLETANSPIQPYFLTGYSSEIKKARKLRIRSNEDVLRQPP